MIFARPCRHPSREKNRDVTLAATKAGPRYLRALPGGRRPHHHGVPYHPSDAELLVGLSSPGAFPCPEGSPSYNVQFSRRAGDGHLVAFGTEYGQLVIVDTRVEARVRRDHSGSVGWGQTDRTRSISSGTAGTRRRLKREAGGGTVRRVGYCRSWGVQQPEVVAQYQALVNCIFDVEWTHDDGRIALGCGDGKVRVHDTETHAEVRMALCFCFFCGAVVWVSEGWSNITSLSTPSATVLKRSLSRRYLAGCTGSASTANI